MIKEIKNCSEEFFNIFEDLEPIWFPRYHKNVLTPYFDMENGKKILLDTLNILYQDKNTDITTLHPKPGKFKTDLQEEKGFEYKYLPYSDLTIADFRDYNKNLNYIIEYKFLPAFIDENKFNEFYLFIEKRYEFLKNIYLYETKKITLKELRIIFGK